MTRTEKEQKKQRVMALNVAATLNSLFPKYRIVTDDIVTALNQIGYELRQKQIEGSERGCMNCRFYSPSSYGFWGRCNIKYTSGRIHTESATKSYDLCDAWQQNDPAAKLKYKDDGEWIL